MGRIVHYCGACGDELFDDMECESLECRIKRDGPIHLQELPCPSCAALREENGRLKEERDHYRTLWITVTEESAELRRRSLPDDRRK
jgi:hypothetical protein